jgi:type III restriction enzyme
VEDEYFADVVHRYSLRQAIEEKFVKKVEYVDELPPAAEKPEEKWQLIYNRHAHWTRLAHELSKAADFLELTMAKARR